VIHHSFSWLKLSAISAITQLGQLYLFVRSGNITAIQVITFLRHLLRHLHGYIIILWDNSPIHKAAKVQKFLHTHRRLMVEWLPPYAPELNPDEWFWAHIKYKELGNACPQGIHELKVLSRKTIK
jgi:putative transposase